MPLKLVESKYAHLGETSYYVSSETEKDLFYLIFHIISPDCRKLETKVERMVAGWATVYSRKKLRCNLSVLGKGFYTNWKGFWSFSNRMKHHLNSLLVFSRVEFLPDLEMAPQGKTPAVSGKHLFMESKNNKINS